MLAVSDTGVGMTDEVKALLFEPLFTTKEVGKGTGLGLSTIYGIVKQSGGTISVYSEPGQGSTFKVYLPRADMLSDETVAPEAHLPRGDETILVVEDNADVRRFTERLLHILGYHVLAAQSGPDALALIEQTQECVQLVLTDVVMPQMSGREFVTKLMDTHPQARILYMSGYTDDAVVHHGVLEAGVQYIQKPFTLEKLARKVRTVLDMRQSAKRRQNPMKPRERVLAALHHREGDRVAHWRKRRGLRAG
jgi:CheY-like chemotaxis protein